MTDPSQMQPGAIAARKKQAWSVELIRAILERLDLLSTVVLDGAVILVALLVRWTLLSAFDHFAPPDTRDLSITALEWISDAGMVGTALIFTAFDLLKRVIRAGREALAELHS